ncbi:MAG: hypothetical protein ACLVBC_17685 [Parabacteroides distasonis]
MKASADERPRRKKTKRQEHLLLSEAVQIDSVVFFRSSEAGAARSFGYFSIKEK